MLKNILPAIALFLATTLIAACEQKRYSYQEYRKKRPTPIANNTATTPFNETPANSTAKNPPKPVTNFDKLFTKEWSLTVEESAATSEALIYGSIGILPGVFEFVLDLKKGHKLYLSDSSHRLMIRAVVPDSLFLFEQARSSKVINVYTGEVLYENPMGSSRLATPKPIYDSLVVIQESYRTIRCVNLNHYRKFLWEYRLSSGEIFDVYRFDTLTLVSSSTGFIAFGNQSGNRLWDITRHAFNYSNPIYHDGQMIIGMDSSIFFLHAATGDTLKIDSLQGNVKWNAGEVVDSLLYFKTDRGGVFCKNLKSYKTVWYYQSLSNTYYDLQVDGDFAYVVEGEKLLKMNRLDGSMLWVAEIEAHISYSSPLIPLHDYVVTGANGYTEGEIPVALNSHSGMLMFVHYENFFFGDGGPGEYTTQVNIDLMNTQKVDSVSLLAMHYNYPNHVYTLYRLKDEAK